MRGRRGERERGRRRGKGRQRRRDREGKEIEKDREGEGEEIDRDREGIFISSACGIWKWACRGCVGGGYVVSPDFEMALKNYALALPPQTPRDKPPNIS